LPFLADYFVFDHILRKKYLASFVLRTLKLV